jgi:hypothetical protein
LSDTRLHLALPACLFAWLLPGGGHLFLGRHRRGLTLLAALTALFGLGLGMHARLDVRLGLDDPLALLVSLCQMATGSLYLLGRALGLAEGRVEASTYEYGNTFTAVAGLLNLLVILDAYDVARARK